MKNKNNLKKGFTLPEILVSTAIGAIILAALFVSFIMFQRSYELQREMTRNQENGRMTLDFMLEEIRNAGYKHYNKGNPVPVNQAVILHSPLTNSKPKGTLPKDCGEAISVMYDIVPSQRDMSLFNFIRREVKYYGEVYQPGGIAALSRCRLKRHQCHYGYDSNTGTFGQIVNVSKYPCEAETILDYVYDISYSFSNYKYQHIAGRLHPLTRKLKSSHNYATGGCERNFKKNVACTQYASSRIRTIDMHLSIISGEEISTVPDDKSDNPDKGKRFLTYYNATMVLRNQ